MNELVINQNNQAVTTSLMVAQTYNKRHSDVLESVNNLIKSMPTENSVRLFEKSHYFDKQGKSRPMYFMNRDGYTLLVMGFTGKDALQFKLAYMDAFNKMEAYIKEQQSQALAPQKPTSALDILQGMLDNLKAQDAKILAVEKRLDEMEESKEIATQSLLTTQYLSPEFAPEMNQRESCRRLLNDYCTATGISQQDAWHDVYARLYYQYGININTHLKRPGEKSKLDVAERIGAIPKIHAIISSMVYNFQKSKVV